MTAMGVSGLAKRVGVGPDTIRYYEKVGLLHEPARTASAYRRYDEAAVDRLRFIQGCQRLGLRLREIKTLLEVRDTGICPCEPAEALLRERLAELDTQLAELTALRAELTSMVERIPSADCASPTPGTWTPRWTDEEVSSCC